MHTRPSSISVEDEPLRSAKRRVMRGRPRPLAAACVALAGLALLVAWTADTSPRRSGDAPPVLIDAPGLWTLQRLGYETQHLATSNKLNLVQLAFRLPPAVAERSHDCYTARGEIPKTCFLIHFHFKIRFALDSPPGYVYASAATNRHTASQVVFAVHRDDGFSVEWSTLDLIRGYDPRVTGNPEIEVDNVNYLQTLGLRAGDNTLDFQLEVPGAGYVESPTFFRIADWSGLHSRPDA